MSNPFQELQENWLKRQALQDESLELVERLAEPLRENYPILREFERARWTQLSHCDKEYSFYFETAPIYADENDVLRVYLTFDYEGKLVADSIKFEGSPKFLPLMRRVAAAFNL